MENIFSTVCEKDIDILILEEVLVSDEFLVFLLDCMEYKTSRCSLVGAWHSLTVGGYGESDLVIVVDSDDGRLGILIENKRVAEEGRNQVTRCFERRDLVGQEVQWDLYLTCMVAPESYLELQNTHNKYRRTISYESISGYFSKASDDDQRSVFKRMMINHAIYQYKRDYIRVGGQSLAEYVEEYILFTNENFPYLRVQKFLSRASESDWISFFPFGKLDQIDIVHQNREGWIKVFLKNREKEDLQGVRKELQGCGVSKLKIERVESGAISIGIKVDSIDGTKTDFNSVSKSVFSTLNQLSRLLEVLKTKKHYF